MKNLFRTRAIALALCVAMVLGIFPGPITAFSVGTDGNNNSVVGAVGVIGAESLLLATAPAGESGHEVKNPVDPKALPAKVVIVDTFEGTDNTWYKLDAAPGYTWPAEYDAYRWTYAYSVDITEPNGTTGIFDANGNVVSSLIMPLYNKIKLNAVSSLVGTVKYQWQICYDVDNNLWVDIYGEDSASINVSYGMVYSLMDSNNTVKMRCKATSGSVVNYSYEFPVTVYEVQETPTEPIEPEEATLEIQMNGAAVSSLKYSYSDYNYAAELSAVTSLSGDVTYKWTFIDENGEESAESFTGANVVLEYDTLYEYRVEIDQYTANTLLRVIASNGNQSLTVDVQFVLYYNSSSDYFTGEDGTEVTVLAVSEAIPEGADLELSPAGNSTTLPEGEEVLVALDITLKDAEGNVWQPADDETVSITMWAASLGLEPGDYFAVYHNHNGVIEKMGPYQVTEDGYVTITVTGFSDFVFVSADPESDVGKTAKIVTASVQLAKNPADISVNIKPVSHNDLPEVVQIIGYYYDEVNSQLWYQVTAPTWKEEYNYLRHYAVEIGDYELDPGTGDGESGTQPSDAALKIQCGGKDVTSVDFFFDYETEMTLNAVLSGAEATSYKWEVCSSATNDKWTTLDSVTDTLVAEYFTFYGHWIEASYTMIRVTAEGTGLTAVIHVNRLDEMPEIKPLEGQVTTSDGGTIDVSVSGELPTGGSLSLAEMDNAAITVEDGEELVVALDITVLNADGSEWQPESGDNITISIPADQLGLSDGEWFVVYHVYNGNSSKIGPKTVKNGYVTFVVNSFSEFDFAITEVDYSDSIGMDAVFNIEDDEYASFMILDEEPTDELQDDVRTYYAEEIPADLVMSVLDWTAYTTDYDAALWYQVSVKEGTAPDGLGDTFWVLQNYLGEDAFESDALILSEPQPEEPDPEEPTEPDIFAECIGMYAVFNAWNEWTQEGMYADFPLKADPTLEESFQWSVYDGDFEIELIVQAKDYYIDAEDKVWILVEPVNGLELPGTLKDHPWVYLNSAVDYNWDNDTLFFFEPEDPSQEDIVVLDKYGQTLWEMYLYSNEKREITVQTNLTGEVHYRWEVCYDTESNLWSPIEGQTSPTLNVSYAVLSGVLQDGEWAALRCVAYNAVETVTSNVIIARLLFVDRVTRSGEQYVIILTPASMGYAAGSSESQGEDAAAPVAEGDEGESTVPDDNKVVVTLTAKKEDGTIILQEPYELEYNGAVTQTVEIPYIKGYDLCDKDGNVITFDQEKNVYVYAVNEANVTESFEIVLTYKPGKTTYMVTYYLQNVLDENYTQYGDSVILEGITGEMVDIDNPAFDKHFDGFYQLLYEVVEIASDGSTEIEIYYDRLYYKMLFDLDGGYGVQPVYARYDTPVSVNNPAKAGYNFVGWDSNKGWTVDIVTGEVDEWDLDTDSTADIEQFTNIPIPAYHTSYTAIWRANDGAKVTVVVWGQNADDDGYSYDSEETFEIYANTGSTITYVPGQYICGFEAHTHDSSCSTTCGETEHTHSVANGCYDRICGKEEHTEHTDTCWSCGGIKTHTISCYQTSDGTLSTSPETDSGRLTSLRSLNGPNYGNLYRINSSGYRYYFKLGDNFYRITGSGIDRQTTVTLKSNCGHTNLHTEHNSSCALTCEEHAHTDACYELKCTTEVHTHSAACYSCGKKEHSHDASCRHTTSYDTSNLWELNEEKTGSVTVAADGSTVYNVYYDRKEFTLTFYDGNTKVYEITERWGKNISSHWPIKGTNGTTYNDGERWDPSGSSQFSEVLVFIELMPAESFDLYVSRVNYDEFRMHYMTEVLPGTTGATSYSFNGVTKYFIEAFDTVVANYNFVTKAEDFFDLKGFEQWTSNPTFGGNGQLDINGGGDVYFYYTRNSYNLVFNNYGTNVRDESVLYQAPLSPYGSYTLDASYAPSVYEEGSVTFKGWYLSPQVPGNFDFDKETPFDFEKVTMPAGDLILYAWWQPVTHNVTFYHSHKDMENGNVYTAGENTYDYDVPHGSKINSPYTPPADPENGRYQFDGWFYVNENGIETLWDFENSTVTSDVKIYAKWTSNELMPYTVRFVYEDEKGNEVEVADPVTGSALAGNTKTFNAKVGTALKPEYQARYFPVVQSHSLTIDIDDETKNVYTFYYVYREKVPYSVYYLTKEDPNNGLGTMTYEGETYYLISQTKTVEDNEKAIVTENAKLIGGYVFDEYQKRLTLDPNDSSKNAVYFFYEKDNVNGQYIVHYMTEVAEGTGFEEHSSFTGKMSDGSVYTVPNPPKAIEHFTWAQGYNDGTNVEKLTGTVTVGQILELWVYYTRDQYNYKVQYLDEDTGLAVADPKLVEDVKWGSTVTEEALTIENYTLNSHSPISIEIQEDREDPTVNIITFYYTENKVTLNYVAVGPEGVTDFGSVNPESEQVKIKTGVAKGSTAVAGKGYKFVGWYSDESCTSSYFLSYDPTWVPQKGAGTIWEDGKTYYAKFEEQEVTINYVAVGPEGATNFGSVSPTTETVPVVTGNPASTATVGSQAFKFVGWYSDEACTKQIATSATYNPAKVDGLHVAATYYAKFEYNQTSLTIKKEGWEDVDPNQTFLFRIVGKDDGVDLIVTVHADEKGNWATTVDGLTVDQEYTVTEVTGWSWRYSYDSVSSIENAELVENVTNGVTIKLGLDGSITFKNKRAEDQWLDGDSWLDNLFSGNTNN